MPWGNLLRLAGVMGVFNGQSGQQGRLSQDVIRMLASLLQPIIDQCFPDQLAQDPYARNPNVTKLQERPGYRLPGRRLAGTL